MAEAKIVSAAGDPERWASMLSPTAYQALKDRVDIDLAVTNPQKFAVDDEVTLLADVKNVKKLRVKIYEINAFNVYLATGRGDQHGPGTRRSGRGYGEGTRLRGVAVSPRAPRVHVPRTEGQTRRLDD